MANRKVARFLILAALVFSLFGIASAKGETHYHWPVTGESWTNEGTDIAIRYGWSACTHGLVTDYVDSASHTVEMDGVELLKVGKDTKYWQEVTDSSWDPAPCMWDGTQSHQAFWLFPLGKLPVGDYEITLTRTLAYEISDGADYDNDGNPLTLSGQQVFESTLHVLEKGASLP